MGDYSPKEVYDLVSIWSPAASIDKTPLLIYPDAQNQFLSCAYDLVKAQNLPDRKDGSPALIHQVSVVSYLQRAQADFTTVVSGMLHDYIEEEVDLHLKKEGLDEEKDASQLDQYELQVGRELESQLSQVSSVQGLPDTLAKEVLETISKVTRHKRHRYYRSIAEIFNCQEPNLQRRAVSVKLADRIHNVSSLRTLLPDRQIFECYKNLFILNNAKRYIIRNGGLSEVDLLESTPENTAEKLFRKCGKATFAACLDLYDWTMGQRIRQIEPELQLFFEKYATQMHGLERVSEWTEDKAHPSKLFDGIIRKYDARLHHEYDEFKRRQQLEKDFVTEFFASYHLNQLQIEALVLAKDAYSMQRVMGQLLYDRNYTLKNFGCSELCSRAGKCMSSCKE